MLKMPPKTNSIIDQITRRIHTKYLGSGDIEVSDSIEFCHYFVRNYGDGPGKQLLKEKILKIE